jgi:diguanylate cyclase (GGDEF)-like protein/PAS domain S-box-containing protein
VDNRNAGGTGLAREGPVAVDSGRLVKRRLVAIVAWRSLKTRVTLFTLAIFVISLWSLAFYASSMLREDMERQLGEQQFSTVSLLAAAINEHLTDRLTAVEQVASRLTPAVLGDHAVVQVFLENRPVFRSLFSGGIFVTRRDGTAIAEAPRSTGRVGLNFMDRDAVAAALQDGKSMIGLPVMGKQPVVPVFGIAAPIHDAQRKVIGAVVGVIALESAGFLDHLTQSRFGKTGGYFLVARKERLIITATNRARIMQPFSAPGVVPAIDRFVEGYEGSAVYTNQFGVEVMNSVKRIAVVDWAISSSIPTAEAFAPIRDMQRRMLMATIMLTLLAGVLTWWMLRRQLSPMLAAAVTLARLSVSEQPPQPLPIANQDEIGELISGLNRLLGTLSQREMALKASERKLFTILESVDAYIYLKDTDGHYLFANRPVRELFGVSMAEIVGQSDDKFFDAQSAARLRANDRRVLEQGQAIKIEETNVNLRDGRTSTYLSVKLSLRDEAGAVYALCGISTDITERKLAEEALARSEAKYRMLFDSTSDAVLMLTEKGFCGCNKAGLEMFACVTEEEFCAYHPADLSPPVQPCGTDSMQLANQYIARAMVEGHVGFEWTHKRADNGETFVAEVWLNAMVFDGNTVLQATCRDISKRKRMEEQVRQFAFFDGLTNLPNRRLLNDRLSQAMAVSKRSGCHGALMFLDLDNFKPVNDRYGHEAGDALLIEAALRLKCCVRETDTVARLGGDEFVVMLSRLHTDEAESTAQADLVAEKIRLTLSEPYLLTITTEGNATRAVEHHCTVSIGVALFLDHEGHRDDILKWADAAMYQAKDAGRNQIRFHDATRRGVARMR